MLNIIKDKPPLSRTGFVTNYPSFRYWRKPAAEAGLAPKPMNVYVHMPYCTQRCGFCYYKTETLHATRVQEMNRYVDALCREIELAAEHFHLGDRPVTTIYFGGGTPTTMTTRNLARVVETLRRNLTLTGDPEFTCEAEPVTLSQRKADALKELGVNRISLGIQSFKDEIIAIAGRRDTEQQGLRAIEIAKATGANVNIDLISGLAGETHETWEHSIARAIETDVENVTVYKLEIFANTEFGAELRRANISVPEDETEMEMIRYAASEFRRANYLPINFFTFTKGGGYVQRHTRSNWEGRDLCAFGSSAFGALGDWAYQNFADIPTYCETVEGGRLPAYRGYVYSSLDRMVRDVMLNLKCLHFDRKRFKTTHGFDLVALCGPTVRQLLDEGLITVTPETISLTEKGMLWGDSVGRAFGAALEKLGEDEEPQMAVGIAS